MRILFIFLTLLAVYPTQAGDRSFFNAGGYIGLEYSSDPHPLDSKKERDGVGLGGSAGYILDEDWSLLGSLSYNFVYEDADYAFLGVKYKDVQVSYGEQSSIYEMVLSTSPTYGLGDALIGDFRHEYSYESTTKVYYEGNILYGGVSLVEKSDTFTERYSAGIGMNVTDSLSIAYSIAASAAIDATEAGSYNKGVSNAVSARYARGSHSVSSSVEILNASLFNARTVYTDYSYQVNTNLEVTTSIAYRIWQLNDHDRDYFVHTGGFQYEAYRDLLISAEYRLQSEEGELNGVLLKSTYAFDFN